MRKALFLLASLLVYVTSPSHANVQQAMCCATQTGCSYNCEPVTVDGSLYYVVTLNGYNYQGCQGGPNSSVCNGNVTGISCGRVTEYNDSSCSTPAGQGEVGVPGCNSTGSNMCS
jgi:hypothetical protein